MIASSHMRAATSTASFSVLALLAAALGACVSCPPTPPLESLPGRDFSTPRRAFEYLQDAIVLGADDDSFAHHEFRCFSARLRRERKIQKGEYFLVREEVRQVLREKIGDPARVRVTDVRALAPDRAEVLLSDGARTARAVVVRENGYEVRFRDGSVEDVYGDFEAPADGLRLERGALTARFAVDEALAARPGLSVDDVYEIRYVSEWKFYSIEDTDLVDDLRRRIDEKQRKAAAEGKAPAAPKD